MFKSLDESGGLAAGTGHLGVDHDDEIIRSQASSRGRRIGMIAVDVGRRAGDDIGHEHDAEGGERQRIRRPIDFFSSAGVNRPASMSSTVGAKAATGQGVVEPSAA